MLIHFQKLLIYLHIRIISFINTSMIVRYKNLIITYLLCLVISYIEFNIRIYILLASPEYKIFVYHHTHPRNHTRPRTILIPIFIVILVYNILPISRKMVNVL